MFSIVEWVNNPTLGEFCFAMIGRADIEGSKSNVAMNAWLPQASSRYQEQIFSAPLSIYPWVMDLNGSTLSGGGRLYLKQEKANSSCPHLTSR